MKKIIFYGFLFFCVTSSLPHTDLRASIKEMNETIAVIQSMREDPTRATPEYAVFPIIPQYAQSFQGESSSERLLPSSGFAANTYNDQNVGPEGYDCSEDYRYRLLFQRIVQYECERVAALVKQTDDAEAQKSSQAQSLQISGSAESELLQESPNSSDWLAECFGLASEYPNPNR